MTPYSSWGFRVKNIKGQAPSAPRGKQTKEVCGAKTNKVIRGGGSAHGFGQKKTFTRVM